MIDHMNVHQLALRFAVLTLLGSAAAADRALASTAATDRALASAPADTVSGSGTLSTATQSPGALDTAAPAASVARPADKTVVFPEVRGSNLEGRDFTLPADFEGDLNLVFIAFQREQQALVDTWVPFAKETSARHPRFRYYELPTIHKLNSVARWFINNGMRRGISDVSAREATITLYLEKEDFRRALDLPGEDTIYVLLVDAEGRVVWRTAGAYTGDHGLEIEQALAKTLSTE